MPPDKEIYKFRTYIRNINKRRNKDVDIDADYLQEIWRQQNGICVYSGFKLLLIDTHKKQDPRFLASVDRIDPTQGYIRGNVQFISASMNYAKSTLTHEQMIEFIQLLLAKTEH